MGVESNARPQPMNTVVISFTYRFIRRASTTLQDAVCYLNAASMSPCVSVPEQINGMIWSNGARTSVCFGAVHGPVNIFGS